MAQAPKTAVDIVFGAMTLGKEGILNPLLHPASRIVNINL